MFFRHALGKVTAGWTGNREYTNTDKKEMQTGEYLYEQ